MAPSGDALFYGFLNVVAALLLTVWYRRSRNPLATIPGPPSSSWLYGHSPELFLSETYGQGEKKWADEYGPVYRIAGGLGSQRLMVSDPLILKQVLNNTAAFPRSDQDQQLVWLLVGDHSIPYELGDEHKRIKNLSSVAFSPANLRTQVPALKDVSQKMLDVWESRLNSPSCINGVVDVYDTIIAGALDILGAGLLGQSFYMVDQGDNELAKALDDFLLTLTVRTKYTLLAGDIVSYLPPALLRLLFKLPLKDFKILRRFSNLNSKFSADMVTRRRRGEITETGSDHDFIGVVFRNNAHVPRSQQMSDPEIAGQIRSIIVAGRDATANALAWSLYELSVNQQWQDELRQEVLAARTKKGRELGFNELDGLAKVNAHIKEVVRMYPGPLFERIAAKDCVLPLSQPLATTTGETITQIPVQKGQFIYGAVWSYNRSKLIWGSDSHEFRPSRWLEGKVPKGQGVGPYANLLSFIGGPRTCLGWKFAILALQIFLSEFLLKFRFELPENADVHPTLYVTLFPVDKKGVPHLPFRLHPV